MKMKSSAVAAVLAVALLAGAGPSRAEPHQDVVYGFLLLVGVTLGVVAWQHDVGGTGEQRLQIRDESGRKKDSSMLLFTPPSRDVEEAPVEIAAGLAWSAKF